MIPRAYTPLTTGQFNRSTTAASISFLLGLWNYPPDDHTFIGTQSGGRWRDHPVSGDREAKITEIFAAWPADRHDIYFCINAFAEPRRKSEHALRSRYAVCDIDGNDPDSYYPQPNILWETSPCRFQSIWIWQDAVAGELAEQYSRNIWEKDGGDKGGWSSTKMLRVPGTVNHKPAYSKPVVTLRKYDGRPQRLPASISTIRTTAGDVNFTDEEVVGDAHAIMRLYRRRVGLQAGLLMTAKRMMRGDRSGAVYQITAALIAAGASDGEIAAVLLVNPYFTDKWGVDPAKAKDQIARIRARLGDA